MRVFFGLCALGKPNNTDVPAVCSPEAAGRPRRCDDSWSRRVRQRQEALRGARRHAVAARSILQAAAVPRPSQVVAVVTCTGADESLR